jgi:hypothetical protein
VAQRHQRLVRCLARVAGFVGQSVSLEQAFPVPAGPVRGRPGDLVFWQWQDGRDFYFDVAVVSPLAHTWSFHWQEGAALRAAVRRKQLHYAASLQAQSDNVRFVPLVFDVFGACHADAEAVVSRLDSLLSSAVVEFVDAHFRSVRVQLGVSVACSVALQLAARLPSREGYAPA